MRGSASPAACGESYISSLIPMRMPHKLVGQGRNDRRQLGGRRPELARCAILSSCHHDPDRALVPVLSRMPEQGSPLGDVLADSGYAHRDATAC